MSEALAAWPDTLREASRLLLELSGADLLPDEYSEQAMRLGVELSEIAQQLGQT
jgi:hypothetical protein